jgi:hypothetical protein
VERKEIENGFKLRGKKENKLTPENGTISA